jgi:hypothetical protein
MVGKEAKLNDSRVPRGSRGSRGSRGLRINRKIVKSVNS